MKPKYVITNQHDEMVSSYRIHLHSSLVVWTTRPNLAKKFRTLHQAYLVAVQLDRTRHDLYISTFIETESHYRVGDLYCCLHHYPRLIPSYQRPST